MQYLEEAASHPPQSTSKRVKRLPPIQTTFVPEPVDPIRAVQRPPPVETVIYKMSPERPQPIPEPPAANRRASKNFLGLFSRSRSVKDLRSPEPSISEGEEAVNSNVAVTRSTPDARHTDNKPKKLAATRKEKPQRSVMTWDPLPLFQAYSQAVKHSTLPAPTNSADAILRIDRQLQGRWKSDFGVLDSISHGVALPMEDGVEDGKKLKRGLPPTATLSWTTKTFILTTSGFLLQYAGTGHHDRLPEKIMQLSSDSAAFASDAIPGKHWVLHVSSSFSEDNAATNAPSRSMFSKFSSRNESKRCATNFLLVMDSAEEMDSWLVSVRKEIQALGGQSYRPDEVAKRDPADALQQLREKPSRRFLIQRNPSSSNEEGGISPKALSQRDAANSDDSLSSTDKPRLWHTDTATSEASQTTLRPSKLTSKTTERGSEPTPMVQELTKVTAPASPKGATASASLLKWELPVNFSPSFSGMGLGSGNDLDLRRESMSSVPSLSSQGRSHRSMSEHSDSQAPNFSVPTFSNRFSRSTRSESIVTPPTSSGNTFRAASPVSPVEKTPPKSTRLVAGNLPTIVTTDEWNDTENVAAEDIGLAHDPNEWEDVEELQPIVSTSFKAPPPKRLSSLGNKFSLFPGQDSESASARPENLIPADLPSPRRHSAMDFSTGNVPKKPKRRSYLPPPPHPPPTVALPPIPAKAPLNAAGPTTTPKLRRPASMQIRPLVRPHTANSMPADKGPQPAMPMTVRERRSFMGRPPSHLLGPPAFPPPSNPLPDIPQLKAIHNDLPAWRPSTANAEPIRA